VLNGYMEGYVHPSGTLLGISTTAAGELLTVRVPSAGSAPVTIEINTDLPPSSPPQPAPKSGQ
ncbi:MAG TPA: hypothetical protein VEH50_09925, partial [Methylomirabilota bacterium]|nr:hypothetical protein [Methylomirabilota bacterium]